MQPTPLRGLYAITSDETDTAALLSAVESVLQAKPALLQYRNKLASPTLRRQQAEAILTRCRAAGVPLIVNDDVRLAAEIGAEGVHLGREDGDFAAARRLIGANKLLGASCYDDFGLAVRAAEAGADYVAFGAFFSSPTKPNAVRASLELLERAKRELSIPVAAIGGITLNNASSLVAAGADLLAVVTDVFLASNPFGRAKAYHWLFFDDEISQK